MLAWNSWNKIGYPNLKPRQEFRFFFPSYLKQHCLQFNLWAQYSYLPSDKRKKTRSILKAWQWLWVWETEGILTESVRTGMILKCFKRRAKWKQWNNTGRFCSSTLLLLNFVVFFEDWTKLFSHSIYVLLVSELQSLFKKSRLKKSRCKSRDHSYTCHSVQIIFRSPEFSRNWTTEVSFKL